MARINGTTELSLTFFERQQRRRRLAEARGPIAWAHASPRALSRPIGRQTASRSRPRANVNVVGRANVTEDTAQRRAKDECQSVCHIEAVSLAIGRFYFDSAIRERVARCSSPRRVPERSRVASSSARTSRKIRNIVAPGLSQSETSGRAVCTCMCHL